MHGLLSCSQSEIAAPLQGIVESGVGQILFEHSASFVGQPHAINGQRLIVGIPHPRDVDQICIGSDAEALRDLGIFAQFRSVDGAALCHP